MDVILFGLAVVLVVSILAIPVLFLTLLLLALTQIPTERK